MIVDREFHLPLAVYVKLYDVWIKPQKKFPIFLQKLLAIIKLVSRCIQEIGVNLIGQAFEQVTDQQISAYRFKAGIQRIASTMITSSILGMSRLHSLIDVLQQVHRMLNAEDQERFAKVFVQHQRVAAQIDVSVYYTYPGPLGPRQNNGWISA